MTVYERWGSTIKDIFESLIKIANIIRPVFFDVWSALPFGSAVRCGAVGHFMGRDHCIIIFPSLCEIIL
jgi:hypothetical protein